MSNNRDDWDAHWERYAGSATQNPAQRMRHELVASILQQVPDTSKIRLLDIGSGQGDLLAMLHSRLPATKFLGAELSDRGVEISKQKIPDATFLVTDISQPSSQMKPFLGWATHATCCEVLEHLDEPVDFLKSAKAYLADGASLIVTVPSGPMSRFDKCIGHRQHFTKNSISRVLENAGFEVTRIYRSGFPFFNLYRLTVIARGDRLIDDVQIDSGGSTSRLALAAMAVYRMLFRFNLTDSPFGWQLVVEARKLAV